MARWHRAPQGALSPHYFIVYVCGPFDKNMGPRVPRPKMFEKILFGAMELDDSGDPLGVVAAPLFCI